MWGKFSFKVKIKVFSNPLRVGWGEGGGAVINFAAEYQDG